MQRERDFSSANSRMARNAAYMYLRLLVSLFINLYSSRFLLEALGIVDYGIYNIVGGFVILTTVLSAAFSNSAQRFLSCKLAVGNEEDLRQTFLTVFNIHVVFAVVTIAIGETLGQWFVSTHLNIPPDRMPAADFVYQLSLCTIAINLLYIPYNALLVAYEDLDFVALVGVLESFLKLGAVGLLFVWKFDSLYAYATILLIVSGLIFATYSLHCRTRHKESRLSLVINRSVLREMAGYVSWAYLGNLAGLLKEQGVSVLVNLFFGVTVNAARAVSLQVLGAVNSFAMTLLSVISPQIVKCYAAGDTERSVELAANGTRYSLYLLYLMVLPLFLEVDFVLTHWLKQVPEHTSEFVRLTMILCLVRVIQQPVCSVYFARGKIRDAQVVGFLVILLSVALCYWAFSWKKGPEYSIVTSIVAEVVNYGLLLWIMKRAIALDIRKYLGESLGVAAIVLCLSWVPAWVVRGRMEEGWGRFVCVTGISVASILTCVFWIGISGQERRLVYAYAARIYKSIWGNA